jgi:hypothetical protein
MCSFHCLIFRYSYYIQTFFRPGGHYSTVNADKTKEYPTPFSGNIDSRIPCISFFTAKLFYIGLFPVSGHSTLHGQAALAA